MIKTKPKDKDEHYDRREKKSDEIFCFSCGAIVKKSSRICPKCGVPLSEKIKLKEKSTSILIALFFSFFAWLYLYEKNVIKFWIGLSVSVIFFIITKNLYYTSNSYWYFSFVPIVIIWIYALIDVAIKDKNYYNSFGG
jgi:predicted RNA-binding Zn-ribbon protein involved in translation (DUF1610 family)